MTGKLPSFKAHQLTINQLPECLNRIRSISALPPTSSNSTQFFHVVSPQPCKTNLWTPDAMFEGYWDIVHHLRCLLVSRKPCIIQSIRNSNLLLKLKRRYKRLLRRLFLTIQTRSSHAKARYPFCDQIGSKSRLFSDSSHLTSRRVATWHSRHAIPRPMRPHFRPPSQERSAFLTGPTDPI